MKVSTIRIGLSLLAITLFHLSLDGQVSPVTTISSVTTSASSATIDVSVTGFNTVTAFDMYIKYDASIATITGVTAGPSLGGNLLSNPSTPGVLVIGWYTFAGVSLPNNTILFQISFSRVNYGTTAIQFDDFNDWECEHYVNFSPALDSPQSTYWIDGSLTFSGGSYVDLSPKVFLDGCYNAFSGLMNDNLRSSSLIPASEPYTGLGFTLVSPGGGETVNTGVFSTTGSNAVIDWVLLELRSSSSPSTVLASRAALLQADGDIVDMDNVSAVRFNGVSPGAYYVAVKHRNHLGVMTASALALSTTTTSIDFTVGTTPAYGSNARIQMVSGIWGLWPGNASSIDNTVIYSGGTNDPSSIFNGVTNASGNPNNLTNYILTGYLSTDLNLDGNTIYSGSGNDVIIIFNAITAHPGNPSGLTNFILTEQIP